MKHFFTVLVASLLMAASSFGQDNSPMVKAEKLYKAFAYHEAVEEYQKVLVKEPENPTALRHIADCYRLTSNTEMSELYYSKVIKLPEVHPIDRLHYAQSLMYNRKYDEAKIYLEEYGSLDTTDERARNFLAAIYNLDEFARDSAKTRVHKIRINSDKADFCPVVYNDGVVFTSSRDSIGKGRTHTWTGNPFLTLYFSKGKGANLQSPELFAKDQESKFNDGPASFNETGNVMYL